MKERGETKRRRSRRALPYQNRPYNVVSALAAEDKWLNSSLAVLCVALWKIIDQMRLIVSDKMQVGCC
jgi:hypothetical protein